MKNNSVIDSKQSINELNNLQAASEKTKTQLVNDGQQIASVMNTLTPFIGNASQQIDMMSIAVDNLNIKLNQSIANMQGLTSAINENILSMMLHAAQTLINSEVNLMFDASVLQVKSNMDLYSQSILGNSAVLDINKLSAEMLIETNTALNDLINLLTQSIDLHAFSVLTNSAVISDNTASVAENKAATDDNIAAKMTFAALESTIQVLTSGLTIATEALNLVKVKEEIQSKKNAAANGVEAASKLGLAGASAAAQAAKGIAGIGIALACLATIGTIVATIKSFVLPGMATGGVVSSPTVTLVGEGRYPEAVVPLGDSPQFAEMKTDIANAVLMGLSAMNRQGSTQNAPSEVVLNVDGSRLARVLLPQLGKEKRRMGYNAALKEV